jgi:DNA-binding transcriptional MocR family regulator
MSDKSVTKLAPIRYESAPLRNRIIASLRSAIENGLLQPGERLIERDLCEQLSVSRTSLREALRELQALGVLAQTGNRSLVVGTLSAGEAANVYSIRAVLEALVVGEFVEHASDEQIEELRRHGNALKQAYRCCAAVRWPARRARRRASRRSRRSWPPSRHGMPKPPSARRPPTSYTHRIRLYKHPRSKCPKSLPAVAAPVLVRDSDVRT